MGLPAIVMLSSLVPVASDERDPALAVLLDCVWSTVAVTRPFSRLAFVTLAVLLDVLLVAPTVPVLLEVPPLRRSEGLPPTPGNIPDPTAWFCEPPVDGISLRPIT